MNDQTREMINFAVITISDSSASGKRTDLSGPALEAEITRNGWTVCLKKIIPDDFGIIKNVLFEITSRNDIEVILTTGGTGFSERDVTPEATREIILKEASGLAEFMRIESGRINPYAFLSRGIVGIRGKTLIINLPGSPKGAVENFIAICPVLSHAVALMVGKSTSH